MYIGYFAQGILKIDVEIAKNSRFWMETSSGALPLARRGRATGSLEKPEGL